MLVSSKSPKPSPSLSFLLGLVPLIDSDKSDSVSSSESIQCGLLPVSFSEINIPVLLSTESIRPSPSVSGFLGSVPVSKWETNFPVFVSTISGKPSLSESLVGSI